VREHAPVAERVAVGSEARREAVLDALPEAVICVDADGIITDAWGSCAAIFGERSDDVLGINAYERVHPDDIAYAAGALAEAITRAAEHIPINLRIRSADGRWVLTEAAAGNLDTPGTLLISLRPLTYRGHMDERRADLQHRCLQIAGGVAAAHGEQLDEALVAGVMSIHEFLHTTAARYCSPDGASIEVGELVAWPAQTTLRPGTFREHGRCGDHSVIEVHIPAAGDARWWLAWSEADPGSSGWDGAHLEDLQLVGAIIASAFSRLDLEADLLRRSRHDPLTGLANRAELERSLEFVLADASATVLFCDLDGYKQVNDRFGHSIGDRVLTVVAERLRGALRCGDVLARVGGDEFVAVCPSMPPDDRARIVTRLEDALATPIRIDSIEATIGVSIGSATGTPGTDATALIAEADAAMYEVKAARKARR